MRFTAITTVALVAATPAFAARDTRTILDGHSQVTSAVNQLLPQLQGLTSQAGSGGDLTGLLTEFMDGIPFLSGVLDGQHNSIGLPLRQVRSLNGRSYDEKSLCTSFGTMGQIGGNFIGELTKLIPMLSMLGFNDEIQKLNEATQASTGPLASLIGEFLETAPGCAPTTMAGKFLSQFTDLLKNL